MRAFLTGASGFVGHWLVAHLEAMGDEVTTLSPEIDISETRALTQALSECQPEIVYHLAAFTHVGRSWEAPVEAFQVNAIGTMGLLEVVRELSPAPRVLLVSSAEVYGTGDGSPLTEASPLGPVTPYASSKVAAEFIGLQEFLGRGLEVVRARPFNHVGPGQSDSFVVSALARRVAEAERSGDNQIRVGNLAAARDFTDVRDVVRAYRLLAQNGIAGEVYNVCSGDAISIATLLKELVSHSSSPIEPVEDPTLFRPIDVPLLLGDCSALSTLTGWRPEIPRSVTMVDVLDDWRRRLKAERSA